MSGARVPHCSPPPQACSPSSTNHQGPLGAAAPLIFRVDLSLWRLTGLGSPEVVRLRGLTSKLWMVEEENDAPYVGQRKKGSVSRAVQGETGLETAVVRITFLYMFGAELCKIKVWKDRGNLCTAASGAGTLFARLQGLEEMFLKESHSVSWSGGKTWVRRTGGHLLNSFVESQLAWPALHLHMKGGAGKDEISTSNVMANSLSTE